MKFFKKKPKAGLPICIRGFARGLARMAKALEKMDVQDGRVEWRSGVPTIIVEGVEAADTSTGQAAAVPLSGDVYINGKHLTYALPPTGRYLKLNYIGGSFDLSFESSRTWAGNYFPAGIHYWDLEREQGDIHWNVP